MSQTSLTGPFGLLVCLVASEDCSALLVLAAGPAQLPTQVVCCVTVRRQLPNLRSGAAGTPPIVSGITPRRTIWSRMIVVISSQPYTSG